MYTLGILTVIIIIFGIGLLLYAIFESSLFGNIKIPLYAFWGGVFVTVGLTILLYHILFTV